MKKTIFALLLVVALVAVLAIPAMASETEEAYNPYHCICGNKQYDENGAEKPGNKECIGDCDGKNHKWIAITESDLYDKDAGKLVGGAYGNYKAYQDADTSEDGVQYGDPCYTSEMEDVYIYLDKSFVAGDFKGPASDNQAKAAGTQIILNANFPYSSATYGFKAYAPFGFHLDLNGNSITGSNVVFRIEGNADGVVDFSISDTKGNGYVKSTAAVNGGGQVIRCTGAVANTINLYNAKLEATNASNSYNGKVICLGSTAKLNAYNCELVGPGAGDVGNGAILFCDGSTVKLYDTNFTKGYGAGGGAIFASGSSVVDLYGDTTISDCKTKNGGAGIWLNSNATKVTMHDNATVTNCTSGNKGAVIICAGDLIMKDKAKIVNNVGTGYYAGGVHFNDPSNSRLTVSGNVQITGNTNGQGAGNVVITKKGATATTWGRIKIAGTLGSDAKIGVSMVNAGTDGWGAGGVGYFVGEFVATNATSTAGFISDSDNYGIVYADGKLSLAAKILFDVDGQEKSWDEALNSGKTIKLTKPVPADQPLKVTHDKQVKLDLAGFTIAQLDIETNAAVRVVYSDNVDVGSVETLNGPGALVSDNADYTLNRAQDGKLSFEPINAFKVNGTLMNWTEAKNTTETVTYNGKEYVEIELAADLMAALDFTRTDKSILFDMKGNNLGAMNIGSNVKLNVFDSVTDGYEDNSYGILYARTGTRIYAEFGNGADDFVHPNTKYRYARVYDNQEGMSFHRMYMSVTDAVLKINDKTADPYMWYTVTLKCTPKLAEQLSELKIHLDFDADGEGEKQPTPIPVPLTIDQFGDDNELTVQVMDSNVDKAIFMNGELSIYAQFRLPSGGYVKTRTRETSVKKVVEGIVATQWGKWETDDNKIALKNMYLKNKAAMESWNIQKVKDFELPSQGQ